MSQTSEINIQFVFAVSGEGRTIAETLLKISDEFIEEAMHDWYINRIRNAKEWNEHWKNKANHDLVNIELILSHDRWCELESIPATPTLFLNGCLLPDIYTLKDLSKLIHLIPTFVK